MKVRLTILIILLSSLSLHADEGMWIPLLLEKYNISDMQEKGFKLSAEDIYSINHSSLKDAVVIFGSGCTGEVVSEEGLLFTNHHCGYGYIQSHSSVEKDYLENGFWAMDQSMELPNEGIKVTFLIRIEDVTSAVLAGVEGSNDEMDGWKQIQTNIKSLVENATTGNHYEALIKPFYYGNEYYMFVYEVFRDVRLVGAPPESIGNYGKDFDNWMWPRHTGDFSVFRIYADHKNQPAEYSPDNVPYKPKKFLPVSLAGVEEGDFTMVMGYPGTTTQFYTSDAIDLFVNKSYPKNIALRDERLSIMDKYMRGDDKIRIQYAAKFRRISNSWKKWQGIILGVNKTSAIDVKRDEEKIFIEWVNEDTSRLKKYGSVLENLKQKYSDLEKYIYVYDFAGEALMTNELMNYIKEMNSLIRENQNKSLDEKILAGEALLTRSEKFFKDYNSDIDRETYAAMLTAFKNNIQAEFYPDLYEKIQKKYKGDIKKYTDFVYAKSKFIDLNSVIQLLKDYPQNEEKLIKFINKEELFADYQSIARLYSGKVNKPYRDINLEINKLYKLYVAALKEMNLSQKMYPDANFTMRVAYGEVEGYNPLDAVHYDFETSLDGIIEKYKKGFEDYTIPEKLIELYYEKNYGNYADEEGFMPVCFVASNHTSGGNSGSPVINANGQLIGLNFDRNWEGTMSDFFYDKSICRNIVVDIRYVLFIIDKYAGAGYLIDEMELVNSK
ncbi:MAG: S46 family peptidase [Bacteroidales bacterium]|nr:S46 family peptidase [Bacteroidales bacterium]MCF8390512.1 S46 family peptidase [Bacteroidales bacterium]